MPKSRRRSQGTKKRSGGAQGAPAQRKVERAERIEVPARTTTSRRSHRLSPVLPGQVIRPQSLIFSGMVALGCLGMAVSFFAFDNDANHMLFGSMLLLMGLAWAFLWGVRFRKFLLLRQRT